VKYLFLAWVLLLPTPGATDPPLEQGPLFVLQEPGLPPGLEPQEPSEEPGLPPGLGTGETDVAEQAGSSDWADRLPAGLNGFVEARVGPRIGSDPAHDEEFTLGEARMQLAWERTFEHVTVDAKGDVILDAVLDEIDTDVRTLRLTFRPAQSLDLRVGRQVTTWGTGDLLFINDLFPKDWQAFFIGRDEEYLKAPSTSVRLGWFPGKVNVDLVYTPEFEPDRYIRGERISFWDPAAAAFRGNASPVIADTPDDDEVAIRLHGNAGSFEIAGYGYRGYWKSPAGMDATTGRSTFPALDVWGASVRGPLGPGIGNVEVGYLDSRDDPDGANPLVNNGQARLLAGYELELASELTGGFQYYVERLLDHEAYVANLPGGPARDENRHVVTARITKMLRSQTLIPSVFAYYSPSDRDGYLRPKLSWKRSDRLILEFGANIFFGEQDDTFFGQFENNSNVYASIRLQP
jgi:hypothetical protein